MADEPTNDDDILDLTNVIEGTDEGADQTTTDDADDDDGEETVIQFGDEDLPSAAPAETDLIKHLRTQIRERDKRLAEVQRTVPVEKPIEVGEKPTLAGCDYDEDAYETARDAWQERKDKAARQTAEAETRATKQSEEWQAELGRYAEDKAALKLPGAEDAEDAVKAALDVMQQSVLILAADRPAVVIHALGNHPAKLAELAKITNPVKLAAAIVKLEGALKVTTKRKAPPPDDVQRGSAGVASGSDKHLEKLEKEAERTGDRTKLLAYRRQLKK